MAKVMSSEDKALREVGNALQDAVYAEVLRANNNSGIPAMALLREARLAEVGMSGSFDLDLDDGRAFRVSVTQHSSHGLGRAR